MTSSGLTQRQQIIVAGFLILLVLIGYTWATWKYFTEPIPGGNDFMAHYTAWEAYIRHGYSPYSDEAALYTQNAIYGRPTRADEDQNRLTYPFYSGLVHAPFILIDYALARAIYMTLLQIALIAGVIMTLDLVKWKPPTWLLALLLVWTLLYYPHARGVILGQFAIFGFFSLAASLYLIKRQRDQWAGAALVLSTVKPTLVFLAAPFMMLWAIARRRWAYIFVLLVCLLVLVLFSFLFLPTWMSEWIGRIFRYSEYTVGQSPIWLLTHVAVPTLGAAGEMVITGILVIGMLVAWWMALRPGGEHWFLWSLGITFVVSNLIVPRSATTNYVMMLVPILWVFAALDRTPGWGRPVLLAAMAISFVGMWWLHYATVIGNQEQPIMFIPAPLALGLVLVLGYRWLMRDARRNDLAL
jgi:hypothetical protein